MSPAVPLGIVASARADSELPSPVSVIQVKKTPLGANGPQTLTFTAPVLPGDKVAVLYVCHRATSVRVISTITGMGATWSGKYTPPLQGSMWLGTNVTSTGSILITQNAAAPMSAIAYLIRGLTADTVSATTSDLYLGEVKTTGLVAGLGQISLHWHFGFDATLGPRSFIPGSPATNWNFETFQQDAVNAFGAAYRTPGATAMQSTISQGTLGDTGAAYCVTLG
jgi:hypothetical protein